MLRYGFRRATRRWHAHHFFQRAVHDETAVCCPEQAPDGPIRRRNYPGLKIPKIAHPYPTAGPVRDACAVRRERRRRGASLIGHLQLEPHGTRNESGFGEM